MTNDNMIKYSAGYIKLNPNFVIQNIAKGDKTIKYYSAFSVVHNILTRGCPTIPSRRLRREFGEPYGYDDFKYALNFYGLNWTDTIKGSVTLNPARKAYGDKFDGIVTLDNKYAGSFIPECPENEVMYDPNGEIGKDFKLDFYSPLYKVDIEIDGIQHQTDEEQKIKDERRYQLLDNHKIDYVRVDAKPEHWTDPVELIEEDDYVSKLIEYNNLDDNTSYYLFAIRIQLLLIDLYMNGTLTLETKVLNLHLYTGQYYLYEGPLKIILDDFYDLLSNVLALTGYKNFEKPTYNCSFKSQGKLENLDGINVDISLTRVYSDTRSKNVIYIRNDYFMYEESKYFVPNQPGKETFWYKKNYYHPCVCDVSYDISEKEAEEPLTYLLQNTSIDYEEFRENQLEIIVKLLTKRAVIGVLPTGAGKSLCYQLCSLLIPGTTILVEPLQLLMADQARNIDKHFGINNVAVINGMSPGDIEILSQKQAFISIVSPERFFSEKFTNAFKSYTENNLVGFVVIDEVHCLSEWGHDFRTSYLCLSHNLDQYFGKDTFLMALTGTAAYNVLEDVDIELRNFKNKEGEDKPLPMVFASSMYRKELNIQVLPIDKNGDYYDELKPIVQKNIDDGNNDKMLIFTNLKTEKKPDSCKSVKARLEKDFNFGDKLKYYAGGDDLSDDDKIDVLNDFVSGETNIVVATKAFGMGLDVPDIRTTVNYGLPASVESLYQGIGRAGRDKDDANCYIIFKKEDKTDLDRLFNSDSNEITIQDIQKNYSNLTELNTNLSLLLITNLEPDKEQKFIAFIYNLIKDSPKVSRERYFSLSDVIGAIQEKNPKITFEKSNDRDRLRQLVDKALYRLFLLGEIKLWKIFYPEGIMFPTYSDIALTPLKEEEKLKHLMNYINRYKASRPFTGPLNFDNRLRFLIDWSNSNYLQSRLRSMKMLYDQCIAYQSSNEFMEFLSEYFSSNNIYKELAETPNDINSIIRAISAPLKGAITQIDKLFASYPDVMGINYVSGIVRLRLNQFKNPDGKYKFEKALQEIRTILSPSSRQDLFKKTYDVLENKCKGTFTQIWLHYYPQDCSFIFRETGDETAKNAVINEALRKVQNGKNI